MVAMQSSQKAFTSPTEDPLTFKTHLPLAATPHQGAHNKWHNPGAFPVLPSLEGMANGARTWQMEGISPPADHSRKRGHGRWSRLSHWQHQEGEHHNTPKIRPRKTLECMFNQLFIAEQKCHLRPKSSSCIKCCLTLHLVAV